MNSILILQSYYDAGIFKVERAECDDEEYKRYTDVCDSYYFKIEITDFYEDLRFGNYSSHTETKDVAIPHESILVKNNEVVGFLYDVSQTPDGFGGHDGKIVFFLEDVGEKKAVGGRATVGCHSTSEGCTLVRRQ